MIYDQVEQCYLTTAATFPATYAALLAAKGVASPGTFTIIKRQSAEQSNKLGQAAPHLGVYARNAATQAKDQEKRDTLAEMTWDFYAEGSDPADLAAQLELAGEAVLVVIDALAGSGLGVFGGGETDGSVKIKMSDGFEEAAGILWWHRCLVTAPVHDRDEPL